MTSDTPDAPTYQLTTERLKLRDIRPYDWRNVQRIGGDPSVAPMMMVITTPWPDAAVKAWIDKSRYRGVPGFRVVVLLDDTIIGVVGIGGDPVSCMWMIDPAYQGHGYATESLRAFFADCFVRFDLAEITSDHFDDNPASARIHTKLGFVVTGHGLGTSAARDAPAPCTQYRLTPDAQSYLRENY